MIDIRKALKEDRTAQGAEIACAFLIAAVVIVVGWSAAGNNLFARQAVVWVANVLMLVAV